MSFTSQYEKSRKSARRSSACEIVITQSFKPSTNAEEMSIRISTDVLSMANIAIGDKVDVLRDEKNDLWMVRKNSTEGFTVSGKVGGPTGLIRYTLKNGHYKLTEIQNELPFKLEFSSDHIQVPKDDNAIIFGSSNDDL